jgi:hypothetical protein
MRWLRWLGNGLVIFLVRVYQYTLGTVLPNSCRFAPTCSEYMVQAVRTHGPIWGTWLGLRRIGRCHPWGGHGWDPVPPRKSCRKCNPTP